MNEERLLEFVTWLWEAHGIRLFDMEAGEFPSVEETRWLAFEWAQEKERSAR